MKRLFIFAIVFPMLVVSCGQRDDQKEPSPLRVRVPWSYETGKYGLEEVEIRTLENLEAFEGESVRFFMNPIISLDPLALDGNGPKARFEKGRDGVFVPLDAQSGQLAVIYAHFEKLLELNQKLGVKKGAIPLPLKVAFDARIFERDSKGHLHQRINDAFYFGGMDVIFLLPFDGKELSLNLNGGVLAHEFFHSIFQHLFYENLKGKSGRGHLAGLKASSEKSEKEKPDEKVRPSDNRGQSDKEKELSRYHFLLERSLNEGLADFWGWVYSKDESFLKKSFKDFGFHRQVTGRTISVRSDFLRREVRVISNDEHLTSRAYAAGSLFSNFLKNLADQEGSEATAKRVIRALPKLAELFSAAGKDEFVSPEIFLLALFDGELSLRNCATFGRLFDRHFLEDERLLYCRLESVQ